MREALEPRHLINLKKGQVNATKLQLTFYIPNGLMAKTEMIVEVKDLTETVEYEDVKQIVDVEAPSAHEKLKVKESRSEIINAITPYYSLKLKNPASVYKVGTSFLKDISNGKKNFGFSSLAKNSNDIHLLVYGSFINYSLNQSVLIVVKDINDKSLDKYRDNFTKGTLWKWDTHDWGDVCFIDYKQINNYADELKKVDLNLVAHDFAAVLWSLPKDNVQDELQKASLEILSKINSLTLVVANGETKNKDLKKSAAYYQCFDIPLKGILAEGELK